LTSSTGHAIFPTKSPEKEIPVPSHETPSSPQRAHPAALLADRDVVPGVSRPQGLFVLAATISFFISVYLFFSGDHERGIFVGLWVPSILSAGALLLGRESRHD
jgi:hypothetical protein